MNSEFLSQLAEYHKALPQAKRSNEAGQWAQRLISILFPTQRQHRIQKSSDIQKALQREKEQLRKILSTIGNKSGQTAHQNVQSFFKLLPSIYESLKRDTNSILKKDPSLKTRNNVHQNSIGFKALSFYRIARELYLLNINLLPSLISEEGYNQTKIDLHPQCEIKEGVIIYSGSTVTGNNTVVGENSVIGGNIWVSKSISPFSEVRFSSEMIPRVAQQLEQLIGNTPMIEVKNLWKNPKVKIFAKLQGNNPAGSVKDRPAFNMISEAYKRGDIKPGMKLIEVTSGNTGIALAMVASMFGIELELVMPDSMSIERTKTMEAFGAKVILRPAPTGLGPLFEFAKQKVKTGEYYQLDQFSNPDNYKAHYKTTGPEIYRDTLGKVTHFVASCGTTGTCMGVSRYLKQKNPDIKIIGVQPSEGNKIAGMMRWAPELLPKIFERNRLDDFVDVSAEDALQMARRMAKEQCIFAGHSSGSTMTAAIRLAETLQQGVIVVIVCDRGDRYLSTPLFGNN